MRLGILADTHNELARTRAAVQQLQENGAEVLIHCGDLASPPILAACAVLPCYFAFGNHDADNVPDLQRTAAELGAHCLGWGGMVDLGGKRVGVVHGHMTMDLRRVLMERPDYLFFGHTHFASDHTDSRVRRINPGALHRADEYTVALLELESGEIKLLQIT